MDDGELAPPGPDPISGPDPVPGPNPVPGRTIGEHGIVGNLGSAALIASDGTVDFLCWPSLDSPSIFASLLDPERGGSFELAPVADGVRSVQAYLPDTNVLTTRWLSEPASAEVTDLMPHPEAPGGARTALVRRLRVSRGTMRFRLRCRPRFDYARVAPTARAAEGGVVFAAEGGPSLRLSGSVPLVPGDGEAGADIRLAAGEEAFVVLCDAADPVPDAEDVERWIAGTVEAWRRWAARSRYRGRWRGEVMRSALALKLLTSARHGSVAAAATFGLPEATGAGRNWDYRATWLRDASFTVYALMRLGYTGEAEAFRGWVAERMRASDGDGRLSIMYAIDGAAAPEERELDHLAGYGGSRPVRIGNGARGQHQLDVYGELIDSLYLANKYGAAIARDGWRDVVAIVDHVCRGWEAPDAGIWELRGEGRHLLHSRLMCWVAIDRAIRLARKRSLPAPLARWTEERDRVADDIWANFRHPERGHFVQERGGTGLDAALLMMPLVRFVSATDPVWLATLDAISRDLADDALVFRYLDDDGLEGGEGAFTACTFWYVECLARAGRLDEARRVMEQGLRFANPLGLFSEETDRLGRPLGNFPQALTHLAFVSAATFLDRRLDDPSGGRWQP